jgi:hypothetical protein
VKTVAFLLALLFPLFLQAEAVDLDPSIRDGQSWLKIVDQGDYPKSWEVASLTLRLKIPQSAWTALLKAVREPLGKVKKRSLIQQTDAKDPENLPKGDYKIQLYATDFSKAKGVKELLMLIQESDGTWRVLTYNVTRS